MKIPKSGLGKKSARGYLDGQMLIASPSMSDDRFAKTLIYICAHSPEGAMGIVVNQPASNIKFPDLLVQLNVVSDEDQITRVGVAGQRPGQADPFLLPSGKLGRLLAFEAGGEPDFRQPLGDDGADLLDATAIGAYVQAALELKLLHETIARKVDAGREMSRPLRPFALTTPWFREGFANIRALD